MSKKKNIKTDERLAADVPTANSSEFVPLSADNLTVPPVGTDELYDFIPSPKEKKYGK